MGNQALLESRRCKLCAIVRKVTSQSLHGKPDESKAYAYLPTVEFTRLDNTIRLCEGVTGVLPCLTRQKLLKASPEAP